MAPRLAGKIVPFHLNPVRPEKSVRVGWIVAPNGCHIWQGSRDDKGYGKVRVDGRPQMVHRVRYEQEVGPIPKGMILDHFVCDNGPGGCCNPEHVRPATHRENLLRGEGASAKNAAKTHCPQGHPLSGENLYVVPRTGWRQCRTCAAAQSRELWARKRAALAATD